MPITVSTGIQYINIDEFTNNVVINENNEYYPVTGDGIFDDLMETATKHLLAQYKANRIRGENFATAYAHIYEVTLQAALSVWLQKPEQAAKVELLNAQTTLTEAQKLNVEADTLLKGAQKDNIIADTQLKGAQKLLIDAQKALTTAQATHEPSKKANTEADTLLKSAQREYILAQKAAALKDEALKTAQTKSENMKTSLYKRQIEGYDENYKEKILKIILDAFTVVFSVASEGFKGGLPKIITVSGVNKLCDIITKDLNIPASNNESTSTWVEKVRNDPNATVPDSYSTAGWDSEA